MAARPLSLPWKGLLSHAWRPYTSAMLLHAVANGLLTLPTVTQTLPMHDADVLPVPGRPRVVHVPGHKPGQVALLLEHSNVLLSGDTLVTRNLYTGRDTEPQAPSAGLNADTDLAWSSLDRLHGIGEILLLSGHGQPWRGSLPAAIDSAKRAAGHFDRSHAFSS